MKEEYTWSGRDYAVMFALMTAPFVLFHGFISNDSTFVAGDGIVDFPYRIAMARKVLSGDWNFWTPSMMCGEDLWTYPVSAPLHPFTYLLGPMPPMLWLNCLTIFCYSIALSGIYLFARLFGIGRIGSVFSAVAYAFSGYFFGYFVLMVHGMGYVAAFAPYLWAAILHTTRKPSPGRAAWAAITVFLLGTGGQDQIFIYSLFVAGYVMLYGIFSGDRADYKKILFWCGAAVTTGLLALSARLIPSMLVVDGAGRDMVVGSLSAGTRTPPPLMLLKSLFTPTSAPVDIKSFYFGFAPVLFAIYGAAHFRKDRRIPWALAGAAIAFFALYSFYVFPENIWSGIPALKWFHSPFRHKFEFFFSAALLGGMGVDFILKNGLSRSKMAAAALCMAPLLYLGFADAPRTVLRSFVFGATMLSAFFVALLFVSRFSRHKTTILAAIIVLLTAQNWRSLHSNYDYYFKKLDAVEVAKAPPIADFIVSDSKNGPGRVVFIGDPFELPLKKTFGALGPNWALLFDIPMLFAKNEMATARLMGLFSQGIRCAGCRLVDITKQGLALDVLNVKYFLVSKQMALPPGSNWMRGMSPATRNSVRSDDVTLWRGETLTFDATYKQSERLVILIAPLSPKTMKSYSLMTISVEAPGHPAIKCELESKGPGAIVVSAGDCVAASHPKFFMYSIATPLPESEGTAVVRIGNANHAMGITIFRAMPTDGDGKITSDIPLMDYYMKNVVMTEKVFSDEHGDLYRRNTAFGAQWLAHSILIKKPGELLDYIKKTPSAPESRRALMSTVMVEDASLRDEAETMAKTAPDPSATIERTIDRADYIEARVSSKTPVFAVFSEKYAKGWSAEIDGKEVPIRLVNYYIRGIYTPAGDHVIRMRYRTPGLKIGLAITGLSVIGIFAMLLVGNRRGSAD